MYCAIIGDLVKSKNINPIERNNLQNKLNNLLIKINNDYKNTIAAKFIITLGDEFQGLLSASYSSIEIIEKIIKELHPHNIRFGIGISDIYTDIKPEGAFFADGPAYYFARNAMDKLKKTKNLSYAFAVRYETNDKNDDDVLLINRMCKLIDILMTGWTTKQRETVGKMIDTAYQQNKVAEELKVNSSTVSRALQGANYKDYRDALNDLKKHLQNKYDFANFEDNELAYAASLHNTGIYLLEQYKYDEALPKLQKALEIRRNKSARETEIANTYTAIGDVYFAKGEYINVLEAYKEALSIREKVLRLDHPDTAASYDNIAEVYRKLGEYEKALELHNKALNIREKVLGFDHLDTASSYNNIAIVYYELGKYEKALDLYNKALSIREKALGTDHPVVAGTYNNIALIYDKYGEYEKALELYNKALHIKEKTLGTDHPDTAITYYNIATIYRKRENPQKTIEYI